MITSSAGESRGYNSRNQTISITGLNGIPTGMGYLDGGQGERTDAGGSHYVTDSLGVDSETKGGATVYYTRTPSGHLVSQRTAAGSYYYLFDGLGSVVGLVDPFGNLAARYGYDPYGQTVVKHGPDNNPTHLTVADGNPWRYTGAYLDSTGLYKLGERYYDPARGRFTQLDPLGDGYRYAGDNPVNFTDPTGLHGHDEEQETGLAGDGGIGSCGCDTDRIRAFDDDDDGGGDNRPGTSGNPIPPEDIPRIPPAADPGLDNVIKRIWGDLGPKNPPRVTDPEGVAKGGADIIDDPHNPQGYIEIGAGIEWRWRK